MIEKNIVNFDLSVNLIKLGVDEESLFYWHKYKNGDLGCHAYWQRMSEEIESYQAYTATEILGMLPCTLMIKNEDEKYLTVEKEFFPDEDEYFYIVYYKPIDSSQPDIFSNNYDKNLANSTAKILIYLVENGIVGD
jgi:hypothetical protein